MSNLKGVFFAVVLAILMSFSVFGVVVTPQIGDQMVVQPTLNADNLLVELEVKDASTPQFWADVYLTSATHTQFTSFNIKLVTSEVNVAKFIASSEFHSPFGEFELIVGGNQDYAVIKHSPEAPETVVLITPGAKTYLGRIKMQNPNDLGPGQALTSGTFSISLDTTVSNVQYGYGKFYQLSLPAKSFCVPKLECAASSCGVTADGCGGFVNCDPANTACVSGQSCVNNACVSAVSLLASDDQAVCQAAVDFDSTDKVLLEGVVNAINSNSDKVDVILDIFTALNAWFTAR